MFTNLDVSTPAEAVTVEYWYRHRTTVENVFRDSKHGAAPRHLPSGYTEAQHRLDVGVADRRRDRRLVSPAHPRDQRREADRGPRGAGVARRRSPRCAGC